MLPAPKANQRPPPPARQILNAIFYGLRSGCQWRFLPKEFGPWETVYGRFRQWRLCSLWSRIHDQLRTSVREKPGKRSRSTAAILDSQTVRSADHAGERGYDAAKKTKGRKRHMLVDTLGFATRPAGLLPRKKPVHDEALVGILVALGHRPNWTEGIAENPCPRGESGKPENRRSVRSESTSESLKTRLGREDDEEAELNNRKEKRGVRFEHADPPERWWSR